ncbi:hypothetical protein ACFCYX_19210 [Streptomyces populi]
MTAPLPAPGLFNNPVAWVCLRLAVQIAYLEALVANELDINRRLKGVRS